MKCGMGGLQEGLGRVFTALGVLVFVLTTLGMGPPQAERPPQPFFQDFFSGSVLLDGIPPPKGTILVACIDSCRDGFESEPYALDANGSFGQLEVKPNREDLVGHLITFYLVNDFGRIKAVETRPYIGVFDFYRQDLTFVGQMPAPAPTAIPEPKPMPTPIAALPVAGDPIMAQLPMYVLMSGTAIVLIGVIMMKAARRRVP